ncbi:MAG: ATPase AAA [Sulfuricurvum sp. PC08-66]|nr:MAG: ATPase AAA [Sulfuricurvum sp. PC08-66]
MQTDHYALAKEAFLDVVDPANYIQIDRVSTLYEGLKKSLEKPLKLVLLYGKPGTGKSMMLGRLYEELRLTMPVHLVPTPLIEEEEFLRHVYTFLLGKAAPDSFGFATLIDALEAVEFPVTPIILLDEAQLYEAPLMEKIRLIADTRKAKFLITLHKTEKEDIIAKEHFQTRIWESIQLHNASKQELQIYIQKKLLKHSLFVLANQFTKKHTHTIHRFTQGNYRDTNKLLYTLFDIYSHYLAQAPTKISTQKLSTKLIEMAGLATGLIHD